MAIDKALYQAPRGIDQIADEEEPIEISIEDPEAVSISGPGFEIDMEPAEEESEDFSRNLAEEMDESTLLKIAGDLISDFESDIAARKDWIQTYVDGLELLGLKIEERMEPWPGACGVYHPLLAESLVKFQAETMMETFPASGPVKTQIIGKETPEKKEKADRVQTDMNYQLTEVMKEYRPEHERMLWGLGLSGNAFKKVYEDSQLGRQVSMYCPAEDVVVPYGASSLEEAERVTHVMRKTANEVRRLQYDGFYREVDMGDPVNVMDEIEKKIAEKLGFRAVEDDRFKLLEMHVELDLPGFEHENEDGEETGIALPYVVTMEKSSGTILAIRRNWKEEDETFRKRAHFVHYPYIPGFGFYAFGLIHLIGAFSKSGTSILRQLVDAGTLSNLPGGFKTRGLRSKGDDTPIAPGEFRDVDVPSGTIKDNLMTLPYKEPSQTLLALLNQIVEDGRRFAGTADLQVSDMSAGSPVGTTLAILERTLKSMSAVQARIHYAMRQEFELLKEIIAANAPEDYDYDPEEGSRHAMKSDYESVNVYPVSDPNAATMAQKVVKYQAALQLAQSAPQLYDLPLLHRQMLDVLGIKNYQKLVPMSEDAKPRDPITENMDLFKGKPVKAFLYQDHQAHIIVHMNAMQDPHMQQILGQNPQMAQQLQAAVSAHVAEHLGMEYRKQMEALMGQTLPPYKEDEDESMMPPDMEVKVAQMAAKAATQMLQQHKQEAQQAQNQQAAQDPLIQLQQQELQLKGQDLQRKTQKDQMDQQAKMAQIAVEQKRIDAQQEAKGAELAIKANLEEKKHKHSHEQQGFNAAADMHKHETGQMADLHKHYLGQANDMQKHQMQLSHQAQMEQFKAAQQAAQVANQPAQKPAKKGE
jgi:hypothetical protein